MEKTLLISVALVLLVVLVFMRRLVPTLAAAVTVPLSIAGTLAAMWKLGYSSDNFSLMALTISVGFVVDDAIVMIENIARHAEMGEPPLQAAIRGARQIGFTVLSISISLVAVFIPITFMGGLPGRLFHEFAVVLTVAIAVSAVVSLTLTPMMCGQFTGLRIAPPRWWAWVDAAVERGARPPPCAATPARSAGRCAGGGLMLLVTLGCAVGTVGLWWEVPKGFLPMQDTGLLQGNTVADPSVSFAAMSAKQQAASSRPSWRTRRCRAWAPPWASASGFSSLNRGQLTIQLKPLISERRHHQRGGDRPAAPQVAGNGGHPDLPLFRAGPARRRAQRRQPVPVRAAGRRTWPSCASGRQKLEAALQHVPPASRT